MTKDNKDNSETFVIKDDIRKLDDNMKAMEGRITKHIETVEDKLNEQIVSVEDRFTRHIRDVEDRLTAYMGTLFEKATGQTTLLAEQLKDTNRRVENLENKMDIVVEAVGDIKVSLTIIEDKLDQKADKKDLIALEKRVSVLENR